jgi:hypothetical protein
LTVSAFNVPEKYAVMGATVEKPSRPFIHCH